MENEIRIHPIGERTTDYEFAEMISRVYPLSFRKAQDVLVATRKYVYKKGLFSTESSRIKNLQTECYELMQTLKKDFEEESAGFRDEEWREKRGTKEHFYSFLSSYSDAFPNWQEEYSALNRLIPQFFEDL